MYRGLPYASRLQSQYLYSGSCIISLPWAVLKTDPRRLAGDLHCLSSLRFHLLSLLLRKTNLSNFLMITLLIDAPHSI